MKFLLIAVILAFTVPAYADTKTWTYHKKTKYWTVKTTKTKSVQDLIKSQDRKMKRRETR